MGSEVQVLTLEEVKAAARKAYDEGRLLAQDGEQHTGCSYELNGYRCGVGSALSQESLSALRRKGLNSKAFKTLVRSGVLLVDFEEIEPISAIQKAHDNWTFSGRDEFRDAFLRLIDHPSAT